MRVIHLVLVVYGHINNIKAMSCLNVLVVIGVRYRCSQGSRNIFIKNITVM